MRTNRTLFGLASFLIGGLAFATLTVTPLFQEAIEPTKEHKMVQMGAGEWSGTITMHNPEMSPEPMKAPCTETVVSVGDLWTTSSFEMDFMGTAFTGASSMGFDPDKGKFIGTWIDSMSTRLTVMEGEWDESKKAIVMHYEMANHMGELVKSRSEFAFGEDEYHSKFYQMKDGAEALTMEIDMKRTAAAAINAGAGK